MDISCNVIRDLLPLYAEDMVSADSKRLVDTHLCGCDDCMKELAALKKAEAVPMETDVTSLKRVEGSIRRRKILTVIAVMLTAAALIVSGMVWLFTPYMLEKTEAIEDVWVTEDGALAIDYARGITGKAMQAVMSPDNAANICNTTRYDWYQAKKTDAMLENMSEDEIEDYIAELYDKEECTEKDWNRFFEINLDYGVFQTWDGEHLHRYDPETWIPENGEWTNRPTDRNQWYIYPTLAGSDMYLMWDAGQAIPDGVLWRTSFVYAYVMFGCLLLAAVLFWVSRKMKGIWRELLSRIIIILVSISVATLLVTGGQLRILEYHLTYEWNQAICTEVMVLSFAALMWYQLHLMSERDKGY